MDGKAPTDDSSSYETEVDHYKLIVFNATTARLIYNLTQTRSLKAAVSSQNSIRMLSLKKWHAKWKVPYIHSWLSIRWRAHRKSLEKGGPLKKKKHLEGCWPSVPHIQSQIISLALARLAVTSCVPSFLFFCGFKGHLAAVAYGLCLFSCGIDIFGIVKIFIFIKTQFYQFSSYQTGQRLDVKQWTAQRTGWSVGSGDSKQR